MFRIAIITYFYGEKSNTVSGLRTESWARALANSGIDVTVFTRIWNTREIKVEAITGSTDYQDKIIRQSENIQFVYLPYKKPWEPLSVPGKKIYNSFLALTGRYSSEADIVQWFAEIQEAHKKKPFTHILTSCHPFSSLILLHKLQKRFPGCITLCDFRDYININLLNPGVSFSLFSKIIIGVQQKWITHYVKKIPLITTASESISEKFREVHGCKQVTTIYNGFEAGLFEDGEEQMQNELFNVSLIGTLYNFQDIDFMLEGILGFLNRNSTGNDIMINFIGVDYYPKVSGQIRNKLKDFENRIQITPRLKRSTAISIMKKSAVLFYVGWKGWKGIYSGKIFEYLGAKKNILIAPNDGDVLEKLINYTNSGKLANTPAEMTAILCEWYEQWKTGEMVYSGIDERIKEFTRESQAKKILQLVTSATGKESGD